MCCKFSPLWYNKGERLYWFQYVFPLYIILNILFDKLHLLEEGSIYYIFYITITTIYAIVKIHIDYLKIALNENYARKNNSCIAFLSLCCLQFCGIWKYKKGDDCCCGKLNLDEPERMENININNSDEEYNIQISSRCISKNEQNITNEIKL